MSTLKKKIKARNGHRSFVKKVMNSVHELLSEESHENLPQAQLESHKAVLLKQAKDIEKLDDEIIDLMEEEEIENEVLEKCDFQASIEEVIQLISSHLSPSTTVNTSKQSPQTPPTDSQSPAQKAASKSGNKVKLPKLSLPSFSGDPTKWISFWDSFESAVHGNSELNDIDKFQYLKSLIHGSAADTISGLSLTNANYKEAVKLLQDRYGDKQVIISKHLETLMQLPQINDSNNLKMLRQLYDKTESTVRSLQGIGVSPESYGTFLTPIIMAKIPQDLRVIISRNSTDEWELNNLLKTLKEELSLREKCALTPVREDQKGESRSTTSKASYRNRNQQSTTAALYTESKGVTPQQENNKQYWCSFCAGKHRTVDCNIITEPTARKNIIRQKGKCFKCLKRGHMSRQCSAKACYRCGQNGHHLALCERAGKTQASKNENPPAPDQNTPSSTDNTQRNNPTTSLLTNGRNKVLLQTARANIYNSAREDQSCNVRLIFDSCSQKTYVSEKVRRSLNLPRIGTDTLVIKTFGETEARLRKCDVVNVAVEALDKTKIIVTGHVVPHICSPISNQAIDLARANHAHLQGIHLADESQGNTELNIDILIGADNYWRFVLGDVKRGNGSGPVALSTRLGYVLSGPVSGECPQDGQDTSTVNISETHVLEIETQVQEREENSMLTEQVKKFWDTEIMGIDEKEPQLYDKVTNEIKFTGERYEVMLPFKESHPTLPDNYAISKSRLGTLLRRLRRKTNTLSKYDEVIQEQIQSNVVEKVPAQGMTGGRVHYLPHKEVIRPNKSTTKLRVVYDASAKQNGPSLNECLYSGPSLTPLIFDILLRFRARKVALIADIEKAFLNVSVSEQDRDFLRFLWVDDIEKENPKIIVLRFTRVVFGLTCSPFLLNATIRHHINQYAEEDPEFTQGILNSIYVDDVAISTTDDNAGYELYQKLKQRFKHGGFNMRKWATNSKKLKDAIDTAEATQISKSEDSEERQQKVLGMTWDSAKDILILNLDVVINSVEEGIVTKKTVLSSIAKVFDPLGILSPIITTLKILFQRICKEKLDWDDPVPVEIDYTWRTIHKDLHSNPEIIVNRCYLGRHKEETVISYELDGFSDASEKAYGGAVYLRIVTKEEVTCSLVAAKTKVAPLGGETIPRLELMGALLLAKLITNTRNALSQIIKIDQIRCWSDSEIVLWWITRTGKEYKQFVQNRVNQIRKLVSPELWNYVPTNQNPADVASRGAVPSQLKRDSQWWSGPTFLLQDDKHWPFNRKFKSEQFDPDPSISSEKKGEVTVLTTNVTDVKESSLENLINATHFNDVYKLFRITAYVLRFVSNVKRKLKNHDLQLRQSELETEETTAAEKLWIKQIQTLVRKDDNFEQVKTSLGLFSDGNGILRCRGRIHHAQLPYETRFPAILPRKHQVTKLLIKESHSRVMHNGVKDTLTHLRGRYWIVKGRRAVHEELAKCVTCKRLEGKPYNPPQPPPLPEFRVSEGLAFTHIGVDYLGPVYVKNIYGQEKTTYKAYVALFTCATSRALHLELVPDMTTVSFIRCLKRFIGRRGKPSLVNSDNAQTFKHADLKRFLAREGIAWKFNVPRSPWWGGYFERMVRCVKRCVKKTLGNSQVTYEEFNTVLIQVEGILNSRPLTYVYDEITEPLTPSHLCIGRRVLSCQDATRTVSRNNETTQDISRRQRYLEVLLRQFWNRWRKEYLTELREFHVGRKQAKSRRVKQGDVVCIYEDKTPRQKWKLGKVQELITGRDGNVRAAVVSQYSGGKRTEIKRPVLKLYPLEVNVEDEQQVEERRQEDVQPRITCVLDQDVPHLRNA